MEFYNALLPYNQNDMIEIRESERYSYCQFIVGKDHTAHGRARHPWLTGSGGWAYYAATHWMLGIRPEHTGLVIDPCIPRAWKGFRVSRQWRGATYDITVENPDGVQKGVKRITMNGREIQSPVPPQKAGSTKHCARSHGLTSQRCQNFHPPSWLLCSQHCLLSVR
jgi:N,N'-diacetylchitobiose phosphorylase